MLLALKVEEGLAVLALLGVLVVDALAALDNEQAYDAYPASMRGTALICILAAASPSLSLSPRAPAAAPAPPRHRYVGAAALLLSALAGTRVASRELRYFDAIYSSAGVILAATALGIIRTLNFDALAGAPLQSHGENLQASKTKKKRSEVSVSASDDALRALSGALLCYLGARQLRSAFDATQHSDSLQGWSVLSGSCAILAGVGDGSALSISLFGIMVAAFGGTLALAEPLKGLPEFACALHKPEIMSASERRRRMLALTPAVSWLLGLAVALLLCARLRRDTRVQWLVGPEASVFGVLLAVCYVGALVANRVPLLEGDGDSESQVAVAGVATYLMVVSSGLCIAARRAWQARFFALLFAGALAADEVALIATDGPLSVYANPTHSFLWVISLSMFLHVFSSWVGFDHTRRGAAAAGVSASLLLFLCSCAVLSTASGERLGLGMLRGGGECATRVARTVAINGANHFLALIVWAGLLVHAMHSHLPSVTEDGGLSEPVSTVLWLGAGSLPWLGWVMAVGVGADAGSDTALSTVDGLAVAIAAALVVAPAWLGLGAACCFVSLVPKPKPGDEEPPPLASSSRAVVLRLPPLLLSQCPCERTPFLKQPHVCRHL